jgi:ribosomal protein S18 acetylase RimI-like enzyme
VDVSDGPWQIAPLRDADCDELGRLHVPTWQQAYAGLLPADRLAGLDPVARAAMWRRSLRPEYSSTTTLVARDASDQIVGFVSVGPTRDEEAPAPLEVWALYLLAHVQGSGLADTLVELSLGDRDASMWVFEDNPRARAFYRRHGFVEDGATSTDGKTGTREIRMVRRSDTAS